MRSKADVTEREVEAVLVASVASSTTVIGRLSMVELEEALRLFFDSESDFDSRRLDLSLTFPSFDMVMEV